MSLRPDHRKQRPPRRGLAAAVLAGVGLVSVALADPLPFREYPGVEYYDYELPTDFREPAEWVFARHSGRKATCCIQNPLSAPTRTT